MRPDTIKAMIEEIPAVMIDLFDDEDDIDTVHDDIVSKTIYHHYSS